MIAGASAKSVAQKITFSFRQATLETVFSEIEKQAGIRFLYNDDVVHNAGPVTLQVKEAAIDDVMQLLTRGRELNYRMVAGTIVVLRNGASATAVADSSITGTVKGPDGSPLPGASVSIKSKPGTGVITDANGRFKLNAGRNATLVVSYVGMQSKEIALNGKTSLHILLEQSDSKLNEVLVVGYGTVTRKDLTGSVASVNMEDLNKAPVASFTEALAGRVAGVQVNSADGQPGVEQNIVIRGANSLTQNNAPLYVVDGFPIEDIQAAALNNEDIESINILKDASATAIYGARAANGVVVITTRKGKTGKPVINFSTSQGFQSIRKKMDMMDPYEFVEYNYELKPAVTDQRYLSGYGRTLEDYRGVAGLDWQQEILANTPITSMYNLSMRGGNADTKYTLSGALFDQDGILRNSGYKRYQGRLGIDQKISSKVKAGVSINYSHIARNGQPVAQPESNTNQSTALLYRVWGYRPVAGAPINLLEEETDEEALTNNEIRLNPVITNDNEFRRNKLTDIIANAYLEIAITPQLTFRTTGGLNNRLQRSEAFFNSKTTQGSPKNPMNTRGQWGSVITTQRNIWNNENTLTYDRKFANGHRMNVIGGFSMQGITGGSNGSAATLVPNEELGIDGLDEGVPYSVTANSTRSALVSLFARANYNIGSRFLFTATIRGDGSSRFSSGNKWGYFPSGAFAWNLGEENFIRDLGFVSSAKVRTSYGVTGNNRVSDFAYLASLLMPVRYAYSFGNGTPTNGVIPGDAGNAGLRWESTRQTDLGIDIGLFKERINLTVDLYRKNTVDLLLNADVPFTTGYGKAFRNIGEIRNEGLEIALNTVNIRTKKFSWESSFNISFNRNRIEALNADQQNLFGFVTVFTQYNNAALYLSQVGQPAGMFYGYIYDGVYQYDDFIKNNDSYTLRSDRPDNGNDRSTIQPGDIKYRDLNGDGTVDSYDQAIIGNGIPLHVGGFTNNFTWRNFQLNTLLQWSYGNNIYNANRLFFEGNSLLISDLNQYKSYTNRWSPENPTNANFRAGGQGPAGRHSSRVLEDGSYLRLKTVSLGYNVPAKVIRRLHLRALNVNVAAQNLITWTNYSGMDPEVSVRHSVLTPGFDYSAYPHARTIVFGLKATL
ncbi:SusC/RagA family TonB-linked outer membrane protein [Chitinophaga cymbidii]|uniref:SusC/RagA family TonB-linked outer membrane protein n=2 Tax=Chitinophaga cymbidii TaxID=1096750 RepID=A0A512RFW5_9BACT|nr:SusC/RagA family TonB-linked outer membrane protein [Chitinophaga cymbidii]